MANGHTLGANLTQADEACYQRFLQRLAQYEQRTGSKSYIESTLDELCQAGELAHAGGMTLRECVMLGLKFNPNSVTSRNVPDVVKEFLVEKRAKAVREESSLYNWRDLGVRLGKFSAAFHGPIHLLQLAPVSSWLHTLRLKAKTWNHYRAAILQLVRFAAARRYAGDGLVKELIAIEKFTVTGRKPDPFTPRELQRLLEYTHHDSPEFVPSIVLVALCGFRGGENVSELATAEGSSVEYADWKDIDFERGGCVVWAGHSKVGDDRQPALPANAIAWLKLYAKPSGPICPVKKFSQKLTRMCHGAGIKRRRNGLRSGFISHRLAVVEDIVKVADEAGTSPEKIKSNYLIRPTKKVGEEWFAIRPSFQLPLL
jgi:integrase